MADRDGEPVDDPADDAADDPADAQQPDQAALAVVARHALHDEELIAAFAGGDLEAAEEADRARALTERCSACRDLHRDIQVIDGLIRAADTAAEYGARVRAPRDFRLTVEDALRIGGPVPVARVPAGGIAGRLRSALTGFARPLGASMAALGVVGLLVGSMTVGSGGMLPSIGKDNAAPTVGPVFGEVSPGGGPSATGSTALSSGSTDGPSRSSDGGQGTPERDSDDLTPTTVSSSTVLQAGSVALLLTGAALLVIGLRGRGRGRE